MIEIKTVYEVLQMSLDIPSFQRPYKWQIKNVIELLSDIELAIAEKKKYDDFKYRIGTVILHNNEKFSIIDGQQRLITLALIRYFLDSSYSCSLLKLSYSNLITQRNIHNNYECIKNWFSLKNINEKEGFIQSYDTILEMVVLTVDKLSSAFQLFDSQNTRGKELDPHDLLKAYHLREMQKDPYEMFHAVSKWEAFQPNKIKNLFDGYLFPILNWSKREKTVRFTTNEIDVYKGVVESSNYTYAKRAKKAEPYFQITEPFISGNDFFEMVAHYLVLLEDINNEINKNDAFYDISRWLVENKSVGFNYAVDLFRCAVLCYYDKFHNFEERAIKNLFTWAMMVRVDMENLGLESINKYAIGESNGKFSNVIPMFSLIVYARTHTDISNIMLQVNKDGGSASSKWENLYQAIRKMNGKENSYGQ